jgi:hypothetical protein
MDRPVALTPAKERLGTWSSYDKSAFSQERKATPETRSFIVAFRSAKGFFAPLLRLRGLA